MGLDSKFYKKEIKNKKPVDIDFEHIRELEIDEHLYSQNNGKLDNDELQFLDNDNIQSLSNDYNKEAKLSSEELETLREYKKKLEEKIKEAQDIGEKMRNCNRIGRR